MYFKNTDLDPDLKIMISGSRFRLHGSKILLSGFGSGHRGYPIFGADSERILDRIWISDNKCHAYMQSTSILWTQVRTNSKENIFTDFLYTKRKRKRKQENRKISGPLGEGVINAHVFITKIILMSRVKSLPRQL